MEELAGALGPSSGALGAHPAPFSVPILERADALLTAWGIRGLILDPFAGVGFIHDLKGFGPTVANELEPEWAKESARWGATLMGDATALPFRDHSVAAVVTSPTYGNRMADHHNARDGSKRITYRHTLGRPLHPRNTGAMQWGDAYREMHALAWGEAYRVLRPGGLFILNVSDHIRAWQRVPVCDWHCITAQGVGFRLIHRIEVPTPRMRFGANYGARVEAEELQIYQR